MVVNKEMTDQSEACDETVKRGKFIVFEGLDGSGKTTQIKRIVRHLQAQGVRCIATKEPTDGVIGNIARQALHGTEPLSVDALALVFAADRAEHIAKEVCPTLEAGIHVLCDRFVYSNMAFQGTAIPLDTIAAYNERSLTAPDMTLFIDVDPEECVRRQSRRKITEIYDGLAFAKEIRALYFEAFERHKGRMPVTVVDGNAKEEEVFARLLGKVSGLLV